MRRDYGFRREKVLAISLVARVKIVRQYRLTIIWSFSDGLPYHDKELPPPPQGEYEGEYVGQYAVEYEGEYEGEYYDDDSYEFDPAALNLLPPDATGYSSSKRALSTISERTEDSKAMSWPSRHQLLDAHGPRHIPSTPTMTSYGQVYPNSTLGADLGRASPSRFSQASGRTGFSSIRTGTSSYGQLIGMTLVQHCEAIHSFIDRHVSQSHRSFLIQIIFLLLRLFPHLSGYL